jgi:hypothetical protein
LTPNDDSAAICAEGEAAPLNPLPDDLERAMCQLCTFLTEVEFIAADAPTRWMSPHQPGLLRGQAVPRGEFFSASATSKLGS